MQDDFHGDEEQPRHLGGEHRPEIYMRFTIRCCPYVKMQECHVRQFKKTGISIGAACFFQLSSSGMFFFACMNVYANSPS